MEANEARARHAYVFYATKDTYAVAVLTFVHLLRQAGARPGIDVLLLHLRLSEYLLGMLRRAGIACREVKPPARAGGWRYRHSLVKLFALEPRGYDRIVYVDADAIPSRSLDWLFDLALDRPVAAPAAYWLPQPFWTSALLVAEPRAAVWDRVERRLQTAAAERRYDMDILNAELGGEIQSLPGDAFRLNSEWEDLRRPGYDADRARAYAAASVVHFSALGKPWSFSPGAVRRLRPHAHPLFFGMWDAWWAAREEVFGAAPAGARARHAVFKLLCRQVILMKALDRVGWRT